MRSLILTSRVEGSAEFWDHRLSFRSDETKKPDSGEVLYRTALSIDKIMLSCFAVLLSARSVAAVRVPRVPPHRMSDVSVDTKVSWETRYSTLQQYMAEWGTADATLETELGRWCAVQRRLHAQGTLSAARYEALEALGLSWTSPSQADAFADCDWEDVLPTGSEPALVVLLE